jgi:cytoskeletal protein RodZ
MDSLGKYLKAERESQNLSLKQVSQSTRIKERLLKAIEEDQYELLSSPVYVKGFLGAYARYLGLDPNDITLRYQKHMDHLNLSEEAEARRRIISKKKRVNLWLSMVSVFAIVLIIWGLIYYFSLIPINHFLSSPERKEPESASSLPSPPTVEKEGAKNE